MTARIAMTGLTFGHLTVLEDLPFNPGDRKSRVRARCVCGAVQSFSSSDLRTGNTKSCGCVAHQDAGKRLRTHGLSNKSSEYSSWVSMRKRCNNPTDAAYANYGGRGIAICERWDDFEKFLADMGPRPPGTSLDRYPNNDGNYEPSNCRWATAAEQARNRRSNIKLTLNGDTKCLLDWCNEKGANYDMAIWWIRVRGLTPEQAFARSVD